MSKNFLAAAAAVAKDTLIIAKCSFQARENTLPKGLRNVIISVFLAAALLLCSCSFEAFGYRFTAVPIEEPPDDDPNIRYYDTAEDGLTADIDYELIRKNGMEYVYESITDTDLKDNICALLRAMDNLEADVNLPHPIPVDEVRTFVHFVSDYICGFTHVVCYSYSYWGDENDEKAYAIRLKYYDDKDSEQAHDELDELNALIDQLVLDAPKKEYEKLKYFYDQVTRRCRYDETLSHPDSRNAYGALLEGYAICQGYANAMQLLLSRAGFEAVPVIGNLSKNESHKWNRVKLSDGKWYDIDTTWDDKPGFGKGGDYKCFLVPEKTLEELQHPTANEAAYFEIPKALDDYKR